MIIFSSNFFQKILLVLAFFSVVLALIYELAYTGNQNFPEGENNIVFSLDVSRSMNVVDMTDFSRLNAAKRKIIDIINNNPGNNYALNIFAGESLRILPFTNDTRLISTFLLGLDSKNLTKQGSDIQSALYASIESFNELQSGKVILISDGTDEEISLSDDIKRIFRDKKIELLVLGVGTESGGFIPSDSPLSPYKIYNGSRVVSKINEQSLQFTADSLDGVYINMKDFDDYSILGESRNTEKFPYIFLFLMFFWGAYLLLIYRNLFIINKIS